MTKLKYDLIWLRSVDRWGWAGTNGPHKRLWVVCHHLDLKVCMSELTAFVFFFSKPPCNLTVGQVAACLQSLPVCNYLHSHFRRLMRPCCFLMEQRRGPEQVGRHSLSRDFWGVQAARCVDFPEPDVWFGCSQMDSHPTDGISTTLQWLVSEGKSLGQGQWRKKGWDGQGRVGKSNGFCFVFLWWLCSLKL